jgi:hypothetical protein
MHTTPEPRWEHWMIGIGTALTTVWPAAVFHHRPTAGARPHDHVESPAEPRRIGQR